MAVVEIAFISPVGIGPMDAAYPSSRQLFGSTVANSVTTASASVGEYAVITATGGDVNVAFGQGTPNASTSDTRRLVLDGQTRSFGPLRAGDKAAVIDA